MSNDVGGDLLPLKELWQALAARWKWLALASALCGGIGAGVALGFPRFEATGFYYTPGWSVADYKRFRSEFGSADDLSGFLESVGQTQQVVAKRLLARSRAPDFWETAVKPLYPFTRKDAKEIFETSKEKDPTAIIGLNLVVPGRTPETAREQVVVLGSYLSETLLLTTLQNWVATNQAATNAELLKVQNEMLRTRYAIEQSKVRIADWAKLQSRYPESQRMEARQVISADAASAKFLAPIAQIVALESSVAESNESLRRMERRAEQVRVEAAFFDRAAAIMRETRRGSQLLGTLEKVKDEVFNSLDLNNEAIKEVATRLQLDLKNFKDLFAIGFGFRTPVLDPSSSLRSPGQFALVGAFLGLMLSALIAVAPVLFGAIRRASQEA